MRQKDSFTRVKGGLQGNNMEGLPRQFDVQVFSNHLVDMSVDSHPVQRLYYIIIIEAWK